MDQMYDPIQHRFWQIREDDGVIHRETSPDGATWSDAGTYSLGPSQLPEPSHMRVKILR